VFSPLPIVIIILFHLDNYTKKKEPTKDENKLITTGKNNKNA